MTGNLLVIIQHHTGKLFYIGAAPYHFWASTLPSFPDFFSAPGRHSALFSPLAGQFLSGLCGTSQARGDRRLSVRERGLASGQMEQRVSTRQGVGPHTRDNVLCWILVLLAFPSNYAAESPIQRGGV